MRSQRSLSASAPLVSLLFLIVLSGCGQTVVPVAPTGDRAPASALRVALVAPEGGAAGGGANLFYPLDLGNHWDYDHTLGVYIIPFGGPPGPVFGQNDRRTRELICIEHRSGRDYVVEQTSYPAGVETWVRYRQDKAGLFEADVDITLPPPCAAVSGRRVLDADRMATRPADAAWAALEAQLPTATQRAAYRAAWDVIQARAAMVQQALASRLGSPRATSVEPGEITRLEYPLHPGAQWVVRANPLIDSTVEGAETLDLTVGQVPAWRIRLGSDFLGSTDHVHFWFGRDGFLKLAAHFEGIATDERGIPIGRVIADETEVLTELSLDGGRFAAH